MKTYIEMVNLFEEANDVFINTNQSLFLNQASERTLCGALMLHLHDLIIHDMNLSGYYVDVEYNRNKGSIKTIKKTIKGQNEQIIPINCDLILHSRGEHPEQDNLIALEMKKSTRSLSSKQKDRERLIALTKDSFDNIWSYDGLALPEHVCRYILGVYFEINYRRNLILIEYYKKGELANTYPLSFVRSMMEGRIIHG